MKLKRAFTLIELLVVISIIALLVAILMPALGKAKAMARDSVCKSNLKTWTTIWGIYTLENEDKFPDGREGIGGEYGTGMGDTGFYRGQWILPLRAQWETHSEILLCPNAKKENPNSTVFGSTKIAYKMGNSSYEQNDWELNSAELCSYGFNNWCYSVNSVIQSRPIEYHWKTTTGTKNSNNIPIFSDSMWRGFAPYDNQTPSSVDGQWTGYGQGIKHVAMNRHQGGINVAFMDWSVRSVGLRKLWNLKWHRNYNTNIVRAANFWPKWMQELPDK
ncbi:MAG: type II secretion system GspH family protein [Phycisphaerae bacterium]|nr:type II secretion system GspH family protein [Phycisphaerae bacterium]